MDTLFKNKWTSKIWTLSSKNTMGRIFAEAKELRLFVHLLTRNIGIHRDAYAGF